MLITFEMFEAIIIQKVINFLIHSYNIDLVSCLLNIMLDPLHDVNHLRDLIEATNIQKVTNF